MKMYGERFLNRKMKAEVYGKTETRDAVVVDIDYAKSTCRVKMQGSSEYIIAYFSELRSIAPSWLRPGAAVRIAHKGGIRGYVDVIGAGQTVPTGISAKPEQQVTVADTVLSGCLLALPKTGRDAFGANKGILWVTTGNYRINNIIKSLPALKATRTNALKMQNRPLIGEIAAQFIINRPSNGNYLAGRALLNKTTGKVTYVASSGTNPKTPVCPDNCLDLGCFLYSYFDDAFNENCLNIEYQKPVPLYFAVTSDMIIAYETEKVPITIEVKDQYGNSMMSPDGWSINITLSAGTGNLSLDGITTRKSIYALSTDLQFTFYYHRVKSAAEKSPTIKISVAEIIGTQDYTLFLINDSGNII